MQVMVLGTSAGRPTEHRHLSAVVVDLGTRWILVDCGEGTQRQLLRFGPSLNRLSSVFVTHLHGDHVLGLPGLLATMGLDGRTAPLGIVGPVGLHRWLEATAGCGILTIPFELEVTEIDDRAAPGPGEARSRVAEVEGHVVETLPLRHRVPAHGYRISEPQRPGRFHPDRARELGVDWGPDFGRLQSGRAVGVGGGVGDGVVHPEDVMGPPRAGRSVAVCMDTAPCESAERLAADADLLIHEATFTESEADLAAACLHSTAAGAAGVAARAGARRLLLTHFSSRHPDPDELVREARPVFAATDAAVEGEWVRVPGRDGDLAV